MWAQDWQLWVFTSLCWIPKRGWSWWSHSELRFPSPGPRLSSTSVPISMTWIKHHRGSRLIRRMEKLELRPGRAWTRMEWSECEMPGPERLLWSGNPILLSVALSRRESTCQHPLSDGTSCPGVTSHRAQCLSVFFCVWDVIHPTTETRGRSIVFVFTFQNYFQSKKKYHHHLKNRHSLNASRSCKIWLLSFE